METAQIGDTIKTNVAIATSSEEKHTFQIGSTIRHISSSKDYDLPLIAKARTGESNASASFNWIIPSGAPKGNYSIIVAVWEGETNGVPFGRLKDKVIANAFEVKW